MSAHRENRRTDGTRAEAIRHKAVIQLRKNTERRLKEKT